MKKWLMLFTLFQVGDAATTLYATQVLGAQELNPLMAFALTTHPLAFIGVKFLGTAWVVLVAHRSAGKVSTLWTMRVMTVLMGLVVLWNLMGVILDVA